MDLPIKTDYLKYVNSNVDRNWMCMYTNLCHIKLQRTYINKKIFVMKL